MPLVYVIVPGVMAFVAFEIGRKAQKAGAGGEQQKWTNGAFWAVTGNMVC